MITLLKALADVHRHIERIEYIQARFNRIVLATEAKATAQRIVDEIIAQEKTMPTLPTWLIWSNEHHAWWRPNAAGYTTDRNEAGRYAFNVAVQIVADANRYLAPNDPPNESMIMEGATNNEQD